MMVLEKKFMELSNQKINKKKEGLFIINLEKSYVNTEILKSINFEVHRSEAVGLLGPNGAGKTTSFHIITGLINSNKGKIIMDGIDITNYPVHVRSRLGLGYLPQEPSVFRGLTVEENLMCILEYTESNENNRRNFLETLLNDFSLTSRRNFNVMKLSGGLRRRVEIARSLCARPNFILLDEPFTGIDPLQLNEIKNSIKILHQNSLVLLDDKGQKTKLSTNYLIDNGLKIINETEQQILLSFRH